MKPQSASAPEMPQEAAVPDENRKAGTRATSYDVARQAGVSQSTVSRVFRDGASVAKATRRKVEAAAEALNYSPSLIARSLITQRSNMIAVVITDPSNRAYPDILFYLGQSIQDTGNRMLVFALPREADAPSIVRDILAYHVDGIISSASLDADFLSACNQAKVPVVLFNRSPMNAMASAICCDHAAGMETLVRHLDRAPMGHVSILSGPQSAPVSRERLEGAMRALAKIGVEPSPVLYGDYTFEGGRRAAAELLAGHDGPHTVVCVNDAMALGVMDACRFDLGLSVPGEVSVTGFDDIPQSSWPSHGLTTVRQPVRRMAQTAVRMLTEQIDGVSGGGERRLLSPEIRIRASTRGDALA